MNLVILLTFIAYCSGAQLNRGYLPPDHAQTSSGSEFLQTPIVVADEVSHKSVAELNHLKHQQDFNEYDQFGHHGQYHLTQNDERRNEIQHLHAQEQIQERSQAALERHASILRQEFENDVDSFSYAYETENGIYGEESGVATDGVKAHGSFSYTGDDGIQYSITYTADENGYRPQGDHLPTPPPIPSEILKSLEDNARDEAAGIYDDGSYREENNEYKTEHKGNVLNHVEVLNQEKQLVVNEADTIITDSAALHEPVLQEPVIPINEHVENHDLHTIANIPDVIKPSQAHRLYLPPPSFQFINERPHNGNYGRLYNNYLTPVHHQVIENQASQVDNVDQVSNDNSFKKTYLPPSYGQVIAARKTYLPPVQERTSNDKESQEGPSRQSITDKKTYLPPYNKQVTQNEGNVQSNNSIRTYLPPSRQTSEESRNRQSSFSSKNGYQ